jgi:hypothetical protein
VLLLHPCSFLGTHTYLPIDRPVGMITVATDEDTFSIDGDLSMTLENLVAILEADVGVINTKNLH